MTHHCFEVIHGAVQYVNPDQIPVMRMDQPLFAKMKQLKWSMGTMYGENKFMLLFGGIHIQLTHKCLGHWMEGSGWVEVIRESKLASAGVDESFLKSSFMPTRALLVYLHILMNRAHEDQVSNTPCKDPTVSFETWCAQRKRESLKKIVLVHDPILSGSRDVPKL